jgi:hypothetical protein
VIASRSWGVCNCGCKQEIQAGDNFIIIDGRFFLNNHSDRTGIRKEVVAGYFGKHIVTKLVKDETLTDEVTK